MIVANVVRRAILVFCGKLSAQLNTVQQDTQLQTSFAGARATFELVFVLMASNVLVLTQIIIKRFRADYHRHQAHSSRNRLVE